MSNKSETDTPFSPRTDVIRSPLGVVQLCAKANADGPTSRAQWAELGHYLNDANAAGYSPGDILYVPAFQLVEREVGGEPVTPVVGLSWEHDGITRVIFAIEGDWIRYVSSGVNGRIMFKATVAALVRARGYPTSPSRKAREWQPINRAEGS